MTQLRAWRGAASLIVAATVGGLAGSQFVETAESQNERATVVQGRQTASDLSVAFRDVIRKVQPAVVAIRTEIDADSVGSGVNSQQEMLDQLRRQMPGFRLPENFKMPERDFKQPGRKSEGVGSGFLLDASDRGIDDPVVLTNNHVIEDADRVYVLLDDGRELKANDWRTDPRSDVAVVFLDGDRLDEKLPTVKLGASDEIEIGDLVLAIGNPFNIGTTSTQGIISGKGRQAGLNARENYLQTDAAINPGNSGGPLVNLRGEVIGINTAIRSRSGGYDGIGFAIPSRMVKWVAGELIEDGQVDRSYLGVQISGIDQDIREQLELPNGVGVAIDQVSEGSPAAKSGLKAGDVIIALGDSPVRTANGLALMVERIEPGTTETVEYVRESGREKTEVAFEAMPTDYTSIDRRDESDGYDELGLVVADLTPELAEQFGYDRSQSGVVVTDVKPGSAADEKDLQPGDVITRVGATNVDSVREYERAVGKLDPTGGILLRGRRGDRSLLEVLKTEK